MKKTLLLFCLMLTLVLLASCTLAASHTCADANGDGVCDQCSAAMSTACVNHIDNNGDGICDGLNCNESVIRKMEDLVFSDKEVIYNGNPKTIYVEGAPEGAVITYKIKGSNSNKANVQTNAGRYRITAYVSADGYEDAELTATLLIKPRTVYIDWIGMREVYPANGKVPTIVEGTNYVLSGILDADKNNVKVDFKFDNDCDFKTQGDFTLTATCQSQNYKLADGSSYDFVVGPNVQTVTFNTGIDNKFIDPVDVEIGSPVERPTLVNLGYEFIGWFNGDEAWDFDTPIEESVTLTARWKPITYKVQYYLNGGTNAKNNPTTYTVQTGLEVAAPTRAGKVFLGWYTDATFKTPLKDSAAGKRTQDVILYAKWSDSDYTKLISADKIDSSFVLDNYISDGAFRYTFTADITAFADDSVIRVGRGFDTTDGSYVELTAGKIRIYNNVPNSTPIKRELSHALDVAGYVVIDIVSNNSVATITVRTASGEFTVKDASFLGKSGEVFAESENCVISTVNLGWAADEYANPVWVLTDSSNSYTNTYSWAYKFANRDYINVLLMGAADADSTAILNSFVKALEISVPKYAVWSFDSESGETYDANLVSFISICKENGITPILTTQFTQVSDANAQKNAAVIASGERYIDFAFVGSCENVYESGKYTAIGTEAMFAKILTDFPEILSPTVSIKHAEAEVLDASNPQLIIGDNKVKDGKAMVVTAKLDGELKEGEKIVIAHGYNSTYAAWLEITNEKVVSYSQGAKADADPGKNSKNHGLTIKNYVTMILVGDRESSNGGFILVTDGGVCTGSYRGSSCNGKITVDAVGGVTLRDVEGSWACFDYQNPIWIFGASYFSLGDPARWPYYMYADGYNDNIFITGRGGLNTTGGLVELKDALQHAVPEVIIWGYGMNDGKDNEDGSIKEVTYRNQIEFLQICKDYGIRAVFISSVNCATNYHPGKIDYVMNRLGDFANYEYTVASLPHAVDGYEVGSMWYDGMLSSDNIHPTALGARNFYLELLCAYPELMIDWDATVLEDKKDTLNAKAELKIDTPDFIDGEYAMTYNADFDGSLDGSITIGTGKRDAEGASWVVITEDKVTMYRHLGGEDVVISEVNNEIVLKEIVMLRIHVKGGRAKISFVSSADNRYPYGDSSKKDPGTLFTIAGDWSYAGDVYAVASGTNLVDASLKFVYEAN